MFKRKSIRDLEFKIYNLILKTEIWKYFPISIKNIIKRFLSSLWNFLISFFSRQDLNFEDLKLLVGGGNFKEVGKEFLQYFIELGELKPSNIVLDVGCGIGRMAIPLTKYLNKNGRYEGFDIIKESIKFCEEKITTNYPNFHFQLADVKNKRYNPSGKYLASKYKFPFKNESFDFIFLTSVFTHMLTHEINNYLREIVRVLKRNNKCLITFFLLNNDSIQNIDIGKSTLDFKYIMGVYRTLDIKVPEIAVAYDEKFIRSLYERYGLKIIEPIRYGSWCGRKNYLSYQDIIIAIKE